MDGQLAVEERGVGVINIVIHIKTKESKKERKKSEPFCFCLPLTICHYMK
jgi:hypothetical protein